MTDGGDAAARTNDQEPGDVARLTFFSDAAVAISLTLLILPVSDYVRESPATDWSTLITDNPELIQAAVSFATVLVCWRYHHVLFERLRDYSRVAVWLNFVWLFCVVSIPVLTLATLPSEDSPYRDYRNILDTLFVRGENSISYQNYFMYWAVIGLSFFLLFLLARHASKPSTGLAKPGADPGGESWIYLRPTLVCWATAFVGLVTPALGDVVLVLGILISVIIARRSSAHARGVSSRDGEPAPDPVGGQS